MMEHFLNNDLERRCEVEAIAADMVVGQEIYALRTSAGLTQQALANLIGTRRSAISRLESAQYRGHSLAMLRKIARALGYRVEIRFVPDEEQMELANTPESSKPAAA
jgi:transcriptional regulator with XRE-family HTH domain